MSGGKAAAEGNALDELERVDRAILERFDEFDRTVDDPALHGTVGKNLVEQLALREAAKRVVGDSLRDTAGARDAVSVLDENTRERREQLDRVEELAQGRQGMYLNTYQDFDGPLGELAETVRAEIPRELEEVIPSLREVLAGGDTKLPSAKYVTAHAPTHPNPSRPRRERFGPVSRLHAMYDHYRGFPEGGAEPMSDVEQAGDPSRPNRRG